MPALAQSQDIYAKYNIYRNPLRVFLNKFTWTVSTGYAGTIYQHELAGFYFFQDNDGQYILSKSNELGANFQGYSNWMSNPVSGEESSLDNPFDVPYDYLERPVNNPELRNPRYLADADTIGLGFSSIANTVPVMASLHFNIKKFRVGGGFQYERHFMRSLKPNADESLIRAYEPAFSKTSYTKFFGVVGYQFYEFWDYTFIGEVQLGRAKAGKEINTNAIGIGQNFYANLGVSIERRFSEYFRLVIRPSYDFKGYVINLPDASSIRHSNNAFMLNIGVSFNIPEIPRSPIKSDHVQLKHVITDPSSGRLMEVRGQPFWKEQNPKIGQNHRRLWRYKLKNRRKISPY